MLTPEMRWERWPQLQHGLPWVDLGTFPTAVHRLDRLSEQTGAEIWVKRDDQSAKAYGGNKVRKLEYLLAAARNTGTQELLTFGAVGSNHVVATAIHGQRLGFTTRAAVFPQPMSSHARRNLEIDAALGVQLIPLSSTLQVPIAGLTATLRARLERRPPPFLIPPGGSSPLGAVGMVAAALELAAQVRSGALPLPARIYVPFGSGGTTAGLALGLAAAGLPTTVIAVRVVDRYVANGVVVRHLARRAARLLRQVAPEFPRCENRLRLWIRHDQFGAGYARHTQVGLAAVRLAAELEQLVLEGTYSGKALAALLADARSGRLGSGTNLLWLTHNGQPLDGTQYRGEIKLLPKPVQELYHRPDHQPT